MISDLQERDKTIQFFIKLQWRNMPFILPKVTKCKIVPVLRYCTWWQLCHHVPKLYIHKMFELYYRINQDVHMAHARIKFLQIQPKSSFKVILRGDHEECDNGSTRTFSNKKRKCKTLQVLRHMFSLCNLVIIFQNCTFIRGLNLNIKA